MLRGEHAGAEHVQKPMHLRLHLLAVLPDGMMEPGRKLDRNVILRRRDEGARDLLRGGERIGRDAAGAQFKPEGAAISRPMVFGQEIDRLFGRVGGRLPKTLPCGSRHDSAHFGKHGRVRVFGQGHLQLMNRNSTGVSGLKRLDGSACFFQFVDEIAGALLLRAERRNAQRMFAVKRGDVIIRFAEPRRRQDES